MRYFDGLFNMKRFDFEKYKKKTDEIGGEKK